MHGWMQGDGEVRDEMIKKLKKMIKMNEMIEKFKPCGQGKRRHYIP